MRPISLLGMVLLVLGAFIVARGVTYSSREEVLRVGDVKASVESKRSVPTWAGGVAIVAGIALVVAGMRRRT